MPLSENQQYCTLQKLQSDQKVKELAELRYAASLMHEHRDLIFTPQVISKLGLHPKRPAMVNSASFRHEVNLDLGSWGQARVEDKVRIKWKKKK